MDDGACPEGRKGNPESLDETTELEESFVEGDHIGPEFTVNCSHAFWPLGSHTKTGLRLLLGLIGKAQRLRSFNWFRNGLSLG